VVAMLVAWSFPGRFYMWPPLVAAALSYIGSVVWLYEKRLAGEVILYLTGLICLVGALLATEFRESATTPYQILSVLDLISSGLLLGVTMAAMLLGHWYLNTPTMELVPLKRLVRLMILAVLVRTLLSAIILFVNGWSVGGMSGATMTFVVLRWMCGLIGALVLALMAWQTLKIPNTQSATGILYVGVIATFLGELVAQLLSVDEMYAV